MNWRRHVLPSALVLALFGTIALAQTITKSIQLSQDPTGTIGYDTQGNVYFPGHINSNGPGTPALTSCGVAPAITGTDTSGKVTIGTAAPSGCVVTFTNAFNATPACIVQTQNPGTSPVSYSASTTALTISSAASAATFNYVCVSTK